MTESTHDWRTVETLEDLVSSIELDRFVTYEIRGRRRDGVFEGAESVSPGHREPDDDGDPTYHSQVLLMHDEREIAVRLVADVGAADAEYTADIAAVYALREPIDPSDEVIEQFIERVAVMTIFPYIRQAISDCSVRVGSPVTLRLLRAGSVLATRND